MEEEEKEPEQRVEEERVGGSEESMVILDELVQIRSGPEITDAERILFRDVV